MIKDSHPLPTRLPVPAHEKLTAVYRTIRGIALKYTEEASARERVFVLTDKVQHRIVYGVEGPTDSIEVIETIALDWLARHATSYPKECAYRLVVTYLPEGKDENRKNYQSVNVLIHKPSWWTDSASDDARSEQPRFPSKEDLATLDAPAAQPIDPLAAIINANNAATLAAQRMAKDMMDAYMKREESYGKTVVALGDGMMKVINGAKELQDRALTMVEKALANSETREQIAAERDIALAEAEASRKKWEQGMAIMQSQGIPMIRQIMEARASAAQAKAAAEARAAKAAAAVVVDTPAVEVPAEPASTVEQLNNSASVEVANNPVSEDEPDGPAEPVPERHALAIAQAMAGLDEDTRNRVIQIVGEERWKRLSDPDASGEEIVKIMSDEIPDEKKLELLTVLPQEALVLLAGAFGL